MNQDLTSLLSALGIISAVLLGWLGRSSMSKKDTEQRAGSGAVLRSDMDYIKRGVDDIKLDVRAQGQRTDMLSERVTRIEESAKQAHKRLDKMEGD